MSNKIFIFGIDGASYELMKNLSNKGILPNFSKVKDQGIFKKMKSSIPEISCVAWSSIITGVNPGEHNIMGFMDIIPGTYSLSYPNFKNLRRNPFWNFKSDKKSIIINVPNTYPAMPLNGVLVSGFVALDLDKSVYPPNKIEDLRSVNYRIDADSNKGHNSKDLFMKELFETLDYRFNLLKMWWNENSDWKYTMFVVTGTDRLGHFFWNAYKNENHRYHKKFIEFYKKTDEVLGKVIEMLDDNDSLIIVSDHGFESINYNVYVNAVLAKNNYLELELSKRKSLNCIKNSTKAFALDPGRIYLHKEKKYPRGSVKLEDEERIINELIKLFTNLKKDDEKVIKKVFRKEEIYKGAYLESAPDIVLLPNKGFNLRGNLFKKEIFGRDIFEGMHKQDNAILLIRTKKSISVPKKPCVTDVVQIIKQIERES